MQLNCPVPSFVYHNKQHPKKIRPNLRHIDRHASKFLEYYKNIFWNKKDILKDEYVNKH